MSLLADENATLLNSIQVSVTPLQFAEHVSRAAGRDVFVKRDDLTHARYGGNKVRKLGYVLKHALQRGVTDVLTMGAVGSNQVLAAIVHGHSLGMRVHAVLVPQSYQWQVERNVRAARAQGGFLYPAQSSIAMARELARVWTSLRVQRRRVEFVPVGASTPRGALGYCDAVHELKVQIDRGDMPTWPSHQFVPLGSGGTHAGIVAGMCETRAPGTVVGVKVTDTFAVSQPLVHWLASRALRMRGTTRVPRSSILLDDTQLGDGYGVPTAASLHAIEVFARDGITLEPTYTAKTAAALLAHAKRSSRERAPLLFWQTYSSAPMRPLLGSDAMTPLPNTLRELFR